MNSDLYLGLWFLPKCRWRHFKIPSKSSRSLYHFSRGCKAFFKKLIFFSKCNTFARSTGFIYLTMVQVFRLTCFQADEKVDLKMNWFYLSLSMCKKHNNKKEVIFWVRIDLLKSQFLLPQVGFISVNAYGAQISLWLNKNLWPTSLKLV